jgi:hypothetical protein
MLDADFPCAGPDWIWRSTSVDIMLATDRQILEEMIAAGLDEAETKKNLTWKSVLAIAS